MTKIMSNDMELIHHLVNMNRHCILAASDEHIVFKDNVDTSEIENRYPDIKIEKDFSWMTIS